MQTGASSNLILTGFMGTGKTVVGRELAQRLSRPFIDMDAEIEARANKSIAQIFSEDGEQVFRSFERDLCLELSRKQELVIATGGGTLIDPSNRNRMMDSGIVICLNCCVDEIIQRVNAGAAGDRPLLKVADPRMEIERLLGQRSESYASIPWQVDTTGLGVEEIAAKIITIADTVTLSVKHPGGAYPIHIGRDVLTHIGGVLRATGIPAGSLVAVVSNTVVARHYGDRVRAALQSAGFKTFRCAMPDGERHKTLDTVAALYDQLLAGGLDRTGTIVALGGGVTGDVAGFAAATFLRGVRFVQIPTTLLSMVDASVGGKTGVDLPQGKNLVGAFKQPALVLIDPLVLSTLPQKEMRSGLAEAIKHGILGAPNLFADLEAGDGAFESWWGTKGTARLVQTLRVKIEIVEQDPFELGQRAVLNLGHTTGHALEQLSGYSLRHGEAVAIGIVAAARIATELKLARPSLADRITALLRTWGLPGACPPFEFGAIWEAMTRDKKRRGRQLRWILPRAIGQVEIVEDVPPEVVQSVLIAMGARSG